MSRSLLRSGGLLLLVFVLAVVPGYSQVQNLLVLGQPSGAQIRSGDFVDWQFQLSVGGTASVELWWDADSNFVLDATVDLQVFKFPMTDGLGMGDGPADQDNQVNGQIYFGMPVGIAPGHYYLVAAEAGVSDTADFTVMPLANPVVEIWGKVTDELNNGLFGILVQASREKGSTMPDFWWAYTDSSGNYSIKMDNSALQDSALWKIHFDMRQLKALIPVPMDTVIHVSGTHGPVNFVLQQPAMKIAGRVTDVHGNPLPGEIFVWAHHRYLNINRDAIADTGGYFLLGFAAQDTGSWEVGVFSPMWGTGFMEPVIQQVQLVAPGDSIYLEFFVHAADTAIFGHIDPGADWTLVRGLEVFAFAQNAGQGKAIVDSLGWFRIPVNSQFGPYDVFLSWDSMQRLQNSGYAIVPGMPVSAQPGDTLYFDLVQGGGIAGTVYGNGAPLRDVSVWVEPYNGGPRLVTLTDSLGQYSFNGLPEGTYRLGVDPFANYLPMFYNNRLRWDEADPVQIAQGSYLTGMDFYLMEGAFIEGTVDDGSNPLHNIEVHFMMQMQNGYAPFAMAYTDTSGYYISPPLPPGMYIVRFIDPSGIYPEQYYPGTSDMNQAQVLALNPGDHLVNIDAHLQAMAYIEGFVYDATGQPLGGAVVRLEEVSQTMWYETVSDSSGFYRIVGIAPGSYILSAHLFGYSIQYWNLKDNPDSAQTIVVDPGAMLAGYDFFLNPRAQESVIMGTVRRADTGAPIPNMVVMALIWPQPPTPGTVFADTTDANGSYMISGLVGGQYKVFVVEKDSFPRQYYDHQYFDNGLQSEGGNLTPVVIADQDTARGIDFDLPVAGWIEGDVTGEGQPLPNATVNFMDVDYNFIHSTTTDGQGHYVSPPLPPMDYFVSFFDPTNQYAPEYWNDRPFSQMPDTVRVASGAVVAGINADLSVARDLYGRVLDQYERGIANIEIRIHNVTTNEVFRTTTMSDGRFMMFNLPPGKYTVTAIDSGGMWEGQHWNHQPLAVPPDTLDLTTSAHPDSLIFHLWSPLEGKVIFSEIMWMGSTRGPDDEWIEFHNTSLTEFVDISGWTCASFDTVTMMSQVLFVFPPGTVMPPNGYLLVSRLDRASSQIDVDPYMVVPNFTLNDQSMLLMLIPGPVGDPYLPLVDVAGDGGPPFAGDPVNYRSMQRKEMPGSGDDPNSWYTSHVWQKVGWDPGAIECGTPGRLNTLPVQLTDFLASVEDGDVRLIWIAATEKNCAGFAVERKADETEEWQEVGFVQGSGTSAKTKRYEFVDSPGSAGVYYYRLKQVDTDGKFTYSEILRVSVRVPEAFRLNHVYPNPFSLSRGEPLRIRVEIPHRSRVRLVVYNLLGQRVAQIVDREFAPGYFRLHWNGRDDSGRPLATGVYFLQMISPDYRAVKKISLVR